MRGQRAPGKKWTPLDRLLLLALQAHEDDLCPGCGTPRTYGMDPDAAGHYHDRSGTCHACAARERAEQNGPKNKAPGQYRYTVPDDVLVHAMTYPIHVNPTPTLWTPVHNDEP